MDWGAYVHLAFDEIRLASAGSPQVARRMAAALDDLLVVALADRRPPLEQQRELLREVIGDAGLARAGADFARMPDSQGIGVAASRERDSHAGRRHREREVGSKRLTDTSRPLAHRAAAHPRIGHVHEGAGAHRLGKSLPSSRFRRAEPKRLRAAASAS
jgi:hypothetical protein